MGSSYAGATANTDGSSYLGYNPATASGVDDWDMEGGPIAVWPTSDAQFSIARTAFGQNISGAHAQEDFVEAAYVPNLSARYRLAPSWSLGLSVGAPWGLTTIYEPTWAGRYHGHETKLLTVNVSPAVAYQPTPELTLAAAFQAQYATGRLSNAIDIGTIGDAFGVPGALPTLQDGYGAFDAKDWGFGYTLGALWSPEQWLQIGASYRSKIDLEMTGPVKFSLGASPTGAVLAGFGLLQDTRGATDLTTPSVASLGAIVKLSDRWSLGGDASFTDWSVFKELRVKFANPLQPDEVTIFDWHDSWFGSLGLTYLPDDDWAMRLGAAYDQSPTGAARNVRIPDADRLSLSAGIDVGLTERLQLRMTFAHIFVAEEPINLSATMPGNLFRGDLNGLTDADATAVGIELRVR